MMASPSLGYPSQGYPKVPIDRHDFRYGRHQGVPLQRKEREPCGINSLTGGNNRFNAASLRSLEYAIHDPCTAQPKNRGKTQRRTTILTGAPRRSVLWSLFRSTRLTPLRRTRLRVAGRSNSETERYCHERGEGGLVPLPSLRGHRAWSLKPLLKPRQEIHAAMQDRQNNWTLVR